MILTGAKNPQLRKKSQYVQTITPETQEVINKMKEILQEVGGVGLAAPQLNIHLRIIICYLKDKFYVFINPEIIKYSQKKIIMEEGCLSLPGIIGEVERPAGITLTFLNSQRKKIKIKTSGLLARIIQHEIDHLEGVLFVDKAKNIKVIKKIISRRRTS